ncbi:hypothetical protein [Chryseobacterium sp.]|uniref:hypothetical protein n=1 Tax=Chryseobacterium sp. TaxID=1871047 RepID=UPI00289A1F06|nr:hypothetical protein [Chryseobacterium sp.]
MKRNLFIPSLFFISIQFLAQDYKQKFTKEVCECVSKVDVSGKTATERQTQFGLCAFKHYQPYKKELKKDFNIDLVTDMGNETKMKEFGVQVGLLMAAECPEAFSNIMKDEDEQMISGESSEMLISGTITKIEKDNFVVFHLVGDNKILNKFYWISTVESDLDLPKEYQSLLKKKVDISYYNTQIFDSKIDDYKNLNIISSLKTE